MSTVATRYVADAVIVCGKDGITVNRPGVVDVGADGRVAYAGAPVDSGPLPKSTKNVGGLLMPGLINAHAHGPMTLLRGVGDGLPLQRWLTEAIWPREGRLMPGDVYWGMKLASIEMLTAGVTTSCEMYFADQEILEAVDHTGGRVMCTPGVLGVVHLDRIHEPDGRIAEIRDLHRTFHQPNGRLTVGVAPHSAYDLPMAIVDELAALARELDVPLHLHVAETQDEGYAVEEKYGKRTVEVLAERGILDGHVLAAHSIWLDDTEIALYGEHSVHVAHCPKSNMKLGSGIVRLNDLRSAGVNVGLGTDGAASNDDLDLWPEIQLAAMLARVAAHDPTLISASEALLMATRDGALAVGIPDTGTLSAGSWADMIRIDLDHPVFTPIVEDQDLIDRLMWAGGARYVTDTWVAGNQVVADDRVTSVDADEARNEVQVRGTRLARR